MIDYEEESPAETESFYDPTRDPENYCERGHYRCPGGCGC